MRFDRGRLCLLAKCMHQPVRETIAQICTVAILQALHATIDAASQVPQPLEEHFVLLMMTGPILRAEMMERCFLEPELPAAILVEFVQRRSDRRQVVPYENNLTHVLQELDQPAMLSGE